VEGIGSMFGFFGGSYTSTSVGLAGNLRCYFNVSHGVNYGNSSQCDKILSVDEISRYQHLKLYPNPTFDKVSLPENFVNSEFEVYSTTGKMILNGILPNTVSIDLSLLPSGIYFIRLTQTNQHAVVVKE
jgi:hypothetical protein